MQPEKTEQTPAEVIAVAESTLIGLEQERDNILA
jgi:hypothetical protein